MKFRQKKELSQKDFKVHPSSASEESARKKEEADEDKRKLDLVFQEMSVDLTNVKTINRFRVRQESNRPPEV